MLKLKYQSSRIFNVITVIVLTGLCLLLDNLTKINFHKLMLPTDKPEFSATGIDANMYSPNGVRLYRLLAESGTQFPDSSKISLLHLIMQTFSESTGALAQQLNSNDGWVDTKTTLGYLGESVVITSFDKDPTKVIHVYTKEVYINGTSQFANSSAPISATQGKSIITGIGFSLDYTKKFLTIESNVKVIYVTN